MNDKRAIIVFLILILWNQTVQAQSPESPFLVVVNPKNNVTSVDKKFLLESFLKKKTRWENNEVIKPVDLEQTSVVRRKFSETLLKRTVAEVKNFWLTKIFTGVAKRPN